VAGLGNPGARYARTRHNIGFMVVDEIAERLGIAFKERELCRIGRGSMEGDEVILVEPLTFMNRSGVAVRLAMKQYNVRPENLIVIQDDIDMETGKLKIRKRGSSGGHRGIASVMEAVGTREFTRVKIGIGRDETMEAEEYVLRKFRKDELPLIREAVTRAVDSVFEIVTVGTDSAMNRFN